jgi:hypothetical protein
VVALARGGGHPCSTSEIIENLSVIAGGGARGATLALVSPAIAVLCLVTFGAASLDASTARRWMR